MKNSLMLTTVFAVLVMLLFSFPVGATEGGSQNWCPLLSSGGTTQDFTTLPAGSDSELIEEEGGIMTATFGMGCFWGPDALFGALPGVIRTRVGYAGGSIPDPEYHRLGDHTETIQVDFDPSIVSYRELLDVFWNNHSATSHPWSRQYMSLILFHDQEQERLALETQRELEGQTGEKVYTEIAPLRRFYRAEDYHQKYALRQHYRVMNVLSPHFSNSEKFTDSPLTARLNAYVAGHASADFLRSEMKRLEVEDDLTQALLSELGISS